MRAALVWLRDWYGLRRHNSRKDLTRRLGEQQRRILAIEAKVEAIFLMMEEATGRTRPELPGSPGGGYIEGLRDGGRIALGIVKSGPPRSPERQRRIRESGLRVVAGKPEEASGER